MKLCVFPNDPIIAYFKKGEIKDRYYNPCNLFEELHIKSFIEEYIEIFNFEFKFECVDTVFNLSSSFFCCS